MKYIFKTFEEKEKNQNRCFNRQVPEDKKGSVYIYNSRKISCDSSLDANLYSSKRLQFADSLLNEVVKNKLKMLDNYIKTYKEGVLKSKNDFFVKCLQINRAQKEEFIKSQKLWKVVFQILKL